MSGHPLSTLPWQRHDLWWCVHCGKQERRHESGLFTWQRWVAGGEPAGGQSREQGKPTTVRPYLCPLISKVFRWILVSPWLSSCLWKRSYTTTTLLIIPPATKLGGGAILESPCPSVRPSVCRRAVR